MKQPSIFRAYMCI